MKELLQKLTEAVGVSGDEHEIRHLIRDEVAAYVDSIQVDAMGNLLCVKKGTGESDLKVMVDAHMDEVGLIVIGIERDGTIRFETVGGINNRTLLGKVVQIGKKKTIGVIGAKPIHLLKSNQRGAVVKADAMRIDIGAGSESSAGRKVNIGDYAAFVTDYEEIGTKALGKSFDDRAGCAVLIELLKGKPFPFDLHAAFTVQEEVGTRGAKVAAYRIKPDAAFVLECTPAYDLPTKRDESPNVILGQGPAIYVMDARTIQDPKLVAHIMKTAASNDIPYQIRQPGGGGTNAASIQRAGAAVPTATLAIPGRYAHSPVMMIDLKDYENLVNLAVLSLRRLTADTINITN